VDTVATPTHTPAQAACDRLLPTGKQGKSPRIALLATQFDSTDGTCDIRKKQALGLGPTAVSHADAGSDLGSKAVDRVGTLSNGVLPRAQI
jgi:hypothetical protein